ncbi:FkbM family methyltransferase [Azospirillum sp. TSO35-2]|uniref:FkbM family methyltransferase n=1 Tax=Azospirillum sp. TSO35-2 TaxID=716796 RepID=UPI000D643DF9|nr:FkbM family methyltransferase [Azospirillum sp. TSO35-2]
MLPNANVVDTEIGRFLLFDSVDSISQHLRRRGTWEPVTLMIAKALVAMGGRNGTVIDGGANVGAFTIPIASAFRDRCRVVSFEVQRPVYHLLCGAIALNGLDNVLAHNLALGSAMGLVDIPVPDYRTDANLGALSLDPAVRRIRREAGQGCHTDTEGVRVEQASMVRIDDFAIDDLCLLKLDVEGMELAVLQGAGETLRRCGYPPLLLELWDPDMMPAIRDSQQALLSHLGSLGYNLTAIGETAVAQHIGQRSVLTFHVEDDGHRIAIREVVR